MPPPAPHEQIQLQPPEHNDIFDEINNHYIDENVNRAADGEAEHPAVNIATSALCRIEVQARAYT